MSLETTRETVGSALAFYERFCQRAEKHMARHSMATKMAADASRAQAAERDRLIAKAEATRKAKQKAVPYVTSVPHWDGVESFEYTWSDPSGKVHHATLILNGEQDVSVRPSPLFPQLLVDMGMDARPIIITLYERRGWRVRKIEQDGRQVKMELVSKT
jgi:hypothetical protein